MRFLNGISAKTVHSMSFSVCILEIMGGRIKAISFIEIVELIKIRNGTHVNF